MHRRTFLKSSIASAALLAGSGELHAEDTALKPPNILWLSAEDLSPDLGCYGDTFATTPNLDAFAQRAIRYDRAFSHAGVCAPSRSGLITGIYPTTIGTQHMRCSGIPPAGVKCFPEYLRAEGYY
ncbi:MAG: sulfatase-like hydrolase/transferase, partial [Verrucomicrobiales bacterium]